ncbi:MAG: hypothetical protein AAF663_09775, partial [Planctomycetota bacterium]
MGRDGRHLAAAQDQRLDPVATQVDHLDVLDACVGHDGEVECRSRDVQSNHVLAGATVDAAEQEVLQVEGVVAASAPEGVGT